MTGPRCQLTIAVPRDRDRGRPAGGGLCAGPWAVFEPRDKTNQLFDGFFVDFFPFFFRGQLRLSQHPGVAVAAGPRDDGRRAVAKRSIQLNGLPSSLKRIVRSRSCSAHVLAIQVEVRVTSPTRRHARQPPGNLLCLHRGRKSLSTVQQIPPTAQHTLRVRLQIRPASTRSRFGMLEPWPFKSTIFLNP